LGLFDSVGGFKREKGVKVAGVIFVFSMWHHSVSAIGPRDKSEDYEIAFDN
jgi:hypothetical protein